MKIYNKNKYLYNFDRKNARHIKGFSLIELAVVMFVVALLLGSILVPLTTQVAQRQIGDTEKNLEEIRDALLGFAATNGYLPCPDLEAGGTPNDGVEDFNAGTGFCTTVTGAGANARAAGNLPWATLGLGRQDAWANRFRYTVLDTYARRAPANTFTLTTTGGLRVCPTAACTGGTELTTTAAAVIISHGSNGFGARSAITNALNPAAVGTDELENTDGDRDAVSRVRSNVTTGGGEFDDIVIWVPKYNLNNRLIAAGRLP